VSALLAAADVSGAQAIDGLGALAGMRARRLLARLGYVTALRHAFPAAEFAALAAPFTTATGEGVAPDEATGARVRGPHVRRTR
jgi:hypothetical protein